jgi:hypothetical protein
VEPVGGASSVVRPRFLAFADTEHGAELGAVPNGAVAQALTKGAIRLPLGSQDSGEASAPVRCGANGLFYRTCGTLSRSRPGLRAGAQEARTVVHRVPLLPAAAQTQL